MSEKIRALESAAFASWPALDGEEDYRGWRLRYGRGYTKRANSANSQDGSMLLGAGQIAEVESRYAQRKLPRIFRLVGGGPDGMDTMLAQRGYQQVDRSLVMTRAITALDEGAGPDVIDDAGIWLAEFAQCNGQPLARQDTHLQMLRAIRADCALAVERRNGEVVCVALGVIADGHLGIFDMVTAPQHRRQGLAGKLCKKLFAWGRARGAHTAYLQVVAANRRALALYEQLGFGEAYEYWYRVKE